MFARHLFFKNSFRNLFFVENESEVAMAKTIFCSRFCLIHSCVIYDAER